MKTIGIIIASVLLLASIAPGEEPDFKALYLKANEAAAQWKARAQMLEARLAESQAETQDARKMLRRALQPVAPPLPPLPHGRSLQPEPSLMATPIPSIPAPTR